MYDEEEIFSKKIQITKSSCIQHGFGLNLQPLNEDETVV